MSANPLRLKFLFEKYLSNACTEQELQEFWQLMAGLSENDLINLDLQQQWRNKEETTSPIESVNWDSVYNRLQERIDTQKLDYTKLPHLKRRKLVKYAVAASLLLCIVTGWWQIQQFSKQDLKNREVRNISGYQTIHLPDGTTVTLNRQSKLSYPVSFDGNTREVYLTGEAYFDVVHKYNQPFMVHTGAFVTKVLGTAFNVKAYKADTNVSVTVSRGKVQVQKATDDKIALAILVPGDQLIVNTRSEKAVLIKVDSTNVSDWRKKSLQLDNVTFEQAAKTISEHYSVSIQFKNDKLKDCRFTGDFTDDSLEQVLDIICTLTNAAWEKDGKGIIQIEGNGCK